MQWRRPGLGGGHVHVRCRAQMRHGSNLLRVNALRTRACDVALTWRRSHRSRCVSLHTPKNTAPTPPRIPHAA